MKSTTIAALVCSLALAGCVDKNELERSMPDRVTVSVFDSDRKAMQKFLCVPRDNRHQTREQAKAALVDIIARYKQYEASFAKVDARFDAAPSLNSFQQRRQGRDKIDYDIAIETDKKFGCLAMRS